MAASNSHTSQTLRTANRARILEQLHRQSCSRAELAQKTGLARSAVTGIVNDLLEEHLVRECPGGAAQKSGRPSVLLELCPGSCFAAGLIINRTTTLLCAVDLCGNVLRTQQRPSASFETQQACTDWLFQTLDAWFAQLETPRARCIGISIGSAGPVDRVHGAIRNPPDFPVFHNYPVATLLRARYDLPVTLENVAVLFAQAEYLSGTMQGYHDTLFVFWAEDGIGSVLLHDGAILHGSGGFAGEIGHTCVEPNGFVCACGSVGCLEAYLKKERTAAQFGPFTWPAVVSGVRRGEARASAILDYFVRYLGIALSNAVNFMDPDSICFYMEEDHAPVCLLEQLSRTIRRRAVVCQAHSVDLFPAAVSHTAPTLAAVAPLLLDFLRGGGRLPHPESREP